jgi:putative transposase
MPSTNATLPTIWEVPDDLWELFQHLSDKYDPPNKKGRRRIPARRALNGMIYRMRTGCQWNQLPDCFGDDASVHRTQQRWEGLGLFDLLWAMLQTRCQELDGVHWEWQAADGCLGKARGIRKRGQTTNAWARTLRIARSRASRKACLSRLTEVP